MIKIVVKFFGNGFNFGLYRMDHRDKANNVNTIITRNGGIGRNKKKTYGFAVRSAINTITNTPFVYIDSLFIIIQNEDIGYR